MKQIDPDQLQYGSALPFDLCNESGEVVIPAGQILEPIDLYLANDRFEGGIFSCPKKELEETGVKSGAATSPAANRSTASQTTTNNKNNSAHSTENQPSPIHVRTLKVGQTFDHALHDQSGQLLIPADSPITDQFLKLLSRRGVRKVFPPEANAQPKRRVAQPTDARDGLGQATRAQRASGVARELDQYKAEDEGETTRPGKPRKAVSNAEQRSQSLAQGKQASEASAEAYREAADAMQQGATPDFTGVQKHLDDLMKVIHQDRHAGALILELQDAEEDYLYDHGCNAASLTMMIAAEMGHTIDEIRESGLGVLLQDVGMLDVPLAIRSARRKLSANERMEVERHPIYTVNTLEKFGLSNRNTLMVAYQCHERCDRSGYPRRRHRMFIHPLARIAAVADTYAALISPRPYRDALAPYDAMAVVLKEVRNGRLDQEVVRAFLDVLSAFPVGSYVLLSNGVPAFVVKATAGQHCKPVVAPVDEKGFPTDEWIDLAKQKKLSIADPIRDIGTYLSGHSKAA